jgi:hypothetical protein
LPASFAVSGICRHLNVPEFSAASTKQNTATTGGVSLDMFLPVISSIMAQKGNALTITYNFSQPDPAEKFRGELPWEGILKSRPSRLRDPHLPDPLRTPAWEC